MKITDTLKWMALALVMFLASFTATAFAAGEVSPSDQSWLELLRPVYESFRDGHYLLAGMLALVAAVTLLKRYAPEKWGIKKFVNGNAGGALLTLVVSFATSMSIQLADAGVSWAMTKTAALIAIGAAGGYSMIKKLIVEPLLRPWYEKTTGVLHSILGVVMYVFENTSPVAKAEQAGEAAVQAAPPAGLVVVVPPIKEVE